MKILHLVHSVDPAGGGVIEGIRQLSRALEEQGHVVEAASLDAPGAPGTTDFPFPLYPLGPGRGTYGYSARLLPWLLDHHRDYDWVLVNGLWQYHGFAAWRAMRRTGLRYAVFTHGMLDPWFKRRYPLKHLKKWLYWPWGEYRVMRDARAVFFTSEAERRDARESFWLYRCREEVVGYGIASPPVDAGRLRAGFLDAYPALRGRRLLLFLGRIHEKKGCDLLLRAWRPADPGARLHLVMAGPDDAAYAQEMKALGNDLGLDITWTGMLSGDLKWGALHAAEVFVLPSHQENFGVAVVEALGCQRPVLISDKVNICEQIRAEGAGLVEPDNLAGTTRLIERWLALSEDQTRAMGEAADRCFKTHYQVEAVARKLIAYLEVL
jgi:glycosyltransferase involved in cell wall biosynthesis